MKKIKILFTIFLISIFTVLFYFLFNQQPADIVKNPQIKESNEAGDAVKLLDFSKINPEFLFSAQIPKEFEVEYISKLKAINIYNPVLRGDNNIEKSQLYISFFKASKFLTLSTVNITRQDKTTIKGHEAILYEITKKDGFPNFLGQPNWRNFKHKAIDVRLSKDSPSYFYSFAYNPSLTQKTFDDFINSIAFLNK